MPWMLEQTPPPAPGLTPLHAGRGLPSRVPYEQGGVVRHAVGPQDADTAPAP